MDQDVIDQINARLGDLHQFNCIVLGGLIGRLGLDEHDIVSRLHSMANRAAEMHPESQVSSMLRNFAELLVRPGAAPHWSPRIIEGGRQD